MMTMSGNDFRLYAGVDFSSEFLAHYGVGHDHGGHSGRYPWGSGDRPKQRNGSSASAKKKKRLFRSLKQRRADERRAAKDILDARNAALFDVLVRGGQHQRLKDKDFDDKLHYYRRHPEEANKKIGKEISAALSEIGNEEVSDLYKTIYDESFSRYKHGDEQMIKPEYGKPDYRYLKQFYDKARKNINDAVFTIYDTDLLGTKAYSKYKKMATLEAENDRLMDKMYSEGITFAEENAYLENEKKIRKFKEELKRLAEDKKK